MAATTTRRKIKSLYYGGGSGGSSGSSISSTNVPYDEHSVAAGAAGPNKEDRRSKGRRSSGRTTSTSTSMMKKTASNSTASGADRARSNAGRPQQQAKVPPPSSSLLRRRERSERSSSSAKAASSFSSNSIIVVSQSSSSSATGSSSSSSSSEQQQKQCPPSKIVQFETTPPSQSRHQSRKKSNSSSKDSSSTSNDGDGSSRRIRHRKTLTLHPDQLLLVVERQQRSPQDLRTRLMIQNLEDVIMDDNFSKMENSDTGAVGGSHNNENDEDHEGDEDEDKEEKWYRRKEYEYERVLLAKRGRSIEKEKEKEEEEKTKKDCYYHQQHDTTTLNSTGTNLDHLDTTLDENDSRNLTYNIDDDVDDIDGDGRGGCRAMDRLELLEDRLKCGVGHGRIGGRSGGIRKNSNRSVTFDDTIVIVSEDDVNDIDFDKNDICAVLPHHHYNCSSMSALPAEQGLKLTTHRPPSTTQPAVEMISEPESSQPRLSNHRSILTSIHEKFLVPIHGNIKNNFANLLLECGNNDAYLLEEERVIIENSTSICTRVGNHTLIRKNMPVTHGDDDDDDTATKSRRESMNDDYQMETKKTKFYAQSKKAEETLDNSNEKRKAQHLSDSFVPIVHSAPEEMRRQQTQQRRRDVSSIPMSVPVRSSTSLPHVQTVAREKNCSCIPTVPLWMKRRKRNNKHNDSQFATKESEPNVDKVLCFIKL